MVIGEYSVVHHFDQIPVDSVSVHESDVVVSPLLTLSSLHCIEHSSQLSKDQLQMLIMNHISDGQCALDNHPQLLTPSGCLRITREFILDTGPLSEKLPSLDLQIRILSASVKIMSLKPLRRVLRQQDINFTPNDNLAELRRLLKNYISHLKKSKYNEKRRLKVSKDFATILEEKHLLRENWPRLVSSTLKDNIINRFRRLTSKEVLSSFTCAGCAESCLNTECSKVSPHDIDLSLLRHPGCVDCESIGDNCWLDPECTLPPLPYVDGILKDILLDPAGVVSDETGRITLLLCKTCLSSLQKNKIPPLSLANRTYLGPVPNELKDLTVVEEAMIARCRAKCWVIQLKDENQLDLPNTQRGMKGHIIVYPQRPSELASILPPPIEDIITPICVIFIGSTPPTTEWLREKAKPLCVRREKVRSALVWLKEHNRHYKNVVIDHDSLNLLDDDDILPFHVEHVLPSHASETLTSRYDSSLPLESSVQCAGDASTPFQNVVVTDVDGHAPPNELRAAAIRHVTKNGGGYIEIPHDPEPVNEFCNPDLFPMIYPTLFPYGIGGFEDPKRSSKISLKRHVRHCLSLTDRRFQEHYSFPFTAFNILQRREALLHTSLKVKKSNFRAVAESFASVSPDAVQVVTDRVANGDFATAHTNEERQILNLMKEVKLITSHVPGSASSRLAMRNEIRALMIDQGHPSFYVTINPADVFNPLVKFLAGAEIDIDQLLPEQVPNYWEQSVLIARNPVVAAKFFHIYLKSFLTAVLGYDPKQEDTEGGILGVVKAYYGCVEAQGRGTLHCHMLIWLEGGLNPNEIKERVVDENDITFRDRLIAFLDDTISNAIPPDPDSNLEVPSSRHHPCSVRGIPDGLSDEDRLLAFQKDLHCLVKQCQQHVHSKTCYKYWKGPPDPKTCRFDLDPENVQLETLFDMETGELCLRCLDGLVNNFNAIILAAIRCNMDLKFIGSGASAKAILYYITDYIMKTQLKSHVAFAALELAVRKLGDYDPLADDITVRAKRMLQKCAYAMISHQELSGQQVCSYLMGFGDHYTSHSYRNLYWTSFENFVNGQDPSPECYSSVNETSVNLKPHLEDSGDDSLIREDGDPNFDISHDDQPGEHETVPNDSIVDDTLETEHAEDVTITMTRSGHIAPKASQVADYLFRSEDLDDVCLWDCIAQVEKVSKASLRTFTKDSHDDDDDDDDESDPSSDHDDCGDVTIDGVYDELSGMSELLRSLSRKRPRLEFLCQHLEVATHVLRVRSPRKHFVPVPVGPAIPRRDREEVNARYCRLMLVFFKPWRCVSDLRTPGQSWQDSFNEYLENAPIRFKKLMDNMQIQHECRDSRDDHYARRRQKQKSFRLAETLIGSRHTDDDFGWNDDDESRVLEHLESISDCNSQRMSTSQDSVLQCLRQIDLCGMYDTTPPPSHTKQTENMACIEVHEKQPVLEELWRQSYEKRRDQWKRNTAVLPVIDPALAQPENRHCNPNIVVRDGADFRAELPSTSTIQLPSVHCGIPVPPSKESVDMSQIINEFTLNHEQTRAFRIVAEHSMRLQSPPLRMYLGGPGGTGKSQVIRALTKFFKERDQGRRFRLASYTGVAARNIQGMTLHSALSLNQRCGQRSKGKTHRDLVAMWEGVDYLFIDEVSMIGCNFLLQISEALIEAKGITSPFGGINIIFSGDFAQLPPVGQTRLFSHLDTKHMAKAATKKGQNTIFGRLLWLSVKEVVLLHESNRQSGPENQPFVDLLTRLRVGACTDADYRLLNRRLINNVQPSWADPSWQTAPIIVTENAVKDAINERATAAFARRTNQELHWYYCTDERGGESITDEGLRSHLEKLHSGQTNQRLGKIPLVLGMPVVFTQNFDVEGGIVNGSTGILKQIRYTIDGAGRRHAISCVVELSDASSPSLPHLPSEHFVALQDTVELTFTHPFSKKKCLIKRTQVPILPAFAITVHKAQGRTLGRAIVDIESCRGTESPYVMISRVTSLDGLLILRPFNKSKISCHQSEESRHESRRLDILRLLTIMDGGSPEESTSARLSLSKTGYLANQHNNQLLHEGGNDLQMDGAIACLDRLQSNIRHSANSHTAQRSAVSQPSSSQQPQASRACLDNSASRKRTFSDLQGTLGDHRKKKPRL
jgi:hypothetical protein